MTDHQLAIVEDARASSQCLNKRPIASPGAYFDFTTDSFRFLDLPAEIRNRIYKLVLGPPYGASICVTEVPDSKPLRGSRDCYCIRSGTRDDNEPLWPVYVHHIEQSDLAVLQVNKQIYTEGFHVLFSTHCFSCSDTSILLRFLRRIGYARRQHLTMLHFFWRGPEAKEAFRLLKTCRRLKSVQFTTHCSYPPGYQALCEVRGLELAKERALVHSCVSRYANLVHNHFEEHLCHCNCMGGNGSIIDLRDLETAMMRPRLKKYAQDLEEEFNLFKPKRERFRKSEYQRLMDAVKANLHPALWKIS